MLVLSEAAVTPVYPAAKQHLFLLFFALFYCAVIKQYFLNERSSPSLKPAAQWQASQFCKSKFIQTEFCAKQKVQLNSQAEAHVSRCT